MIRIELSPYEQKDILEVLDVALEEYIYRKGIDDMANYWIQRIPELKKVIKGQVNGPKMTKETIWNN